MQSFLKLLLPVVLLGSAIGGLVYWFEAPAEGRQPVAWGQQTCAHCQMHISNRHYAAQLHTRNNGVKHFDDPGCLFEWIADQTPSIKTAYFHHYDKPGTWLDYREVGFIQVDRTTPMGYGLGAVATSNHDDAMPFHTASSKIMSGQIKAHSHGDRPTRKQPRQPKEAK